MPALVNFREVPRYALQSLDDRCHALGGGTAMIVADGLRDRAVASVVTGARTPPTILKAGGARCSSVFSGSAIAFGCQGVVIAAAALAVARRS